jgi:DENN (AEX-3) domain
MLNGNPVVPKSLHELEFDLMEYHWHCPTLFSLFTPKMLFKILTAVLLERSIIFVHDNLAVLTSVVIAIKTLIRPF